MLVRRLSQVPAVVALTAVMAMSSTAHAAAAVSTPADVSAAEPSLARAHEVLTSPQATDGTTTQAEAAAVAEEISIHATESSSGPLPLAASNGRQVMTADLGEVTVSVPRDPSSPTRLTTAEGSTVRLFDPSSQAADDVREAAPGVVVSNANNGTMNATVVTDTGVQQVRIITDPSAPERFPTRVVLSPGQTLTDAGAGAFVVTDADGAVSLSVAAPWAKDAVGRQVPTHYEWDGTNLTQVVEFKDGDYTFPITADPFWSTVRDYFHCIIGAGVPMGVAAAFVSYVGPAALMNMAMNKLGSARLGGPPMLGVLLKPYARSVWNACARFVRS